MSDMPVGPEGMPSLTLRETKYPLFFPAAGVKLWAEHKGLEFQVAVAEGWEPAKLTDKETRFLLRLGFESAEFRRQMFCPGPARAFDEEFIDQILQIHHLQDIWNALLTAWNNAPAREPDPPMTQNPSDGPVSYD